MISCAVYGCTNNTLTTPDPSIQYYYFPKHPLIAQQWLNACCWRPDQIDTSTARICSVHFDSDSYTSEYKMLDYLGCYTKVLKYDAVPTLYLPSTTPLIIKDNIEPPENAEATILDGCEIKNFIIYTTAPVQPVQPEQISFETNTVIESVKAESEEKNEKYKHIQSKEQLEQLKLENEYLRKEIDNLNQLVKKHGEEASVKHELYKTKDFELNKLQQQYNRLYRNTITLQEEKNILSKVFSESQIKILSGKKKIYWSNDDMAMGYTIRHMSNKRCYMYLSKNLNIPLPALSSIKRWATLKKGEFIKLEMKKDKFEANNE